MKKEWFLSCGKYLILLIMLAIVLFPLLIVIAYTFTPLEDLGKYIMFPPTLSLRNVTVVLFKTRFLNYMGNTLYVAMLITISSTFINSIASYAFARMNFPLKNVLFMVLVSTLIIPAEALLLPQFTLVSSFHWIDSYKAIVVPAMASSFGIFFMRQFFLSLPRDLEDSAFVDGCGWFRTYFSIMLPLVRAPLLTISLLTFMGVWDSFIWPMTVINSVEKHLVQVAISILNSEDFVDIGAQYANVFLCSLPIVILFLLVQKQYIAGVTAGSIKG